MRKLSYDPTTWADFKKGESIACPESEAHIKLSEPGAVYVKIEGNWQLVHHGTEMKILFPSPGYEIKATAPGAIFIDPQEPIEDHNEVLTNMDKRPGKNGAEEAIQKMLRLQKLKEQSEAIEREEANLREALRRRARGLQETLPEGINEPPEPEPVVEDPPQNPPQQPPSEPVTETA